MTRLNYAIVSLRITIVSLLGVLFSTVVAQPDTTQVDAALTSFQNAACNIADGIRGPIGAAVIIIILVVTGISIMMGQQGGARKIAFAIVGLFILGLIPTILNIAGLTANCP